jgi:hypothetical protein
MTTRRDRISPADRSAVPQLYQLKVTLMDSKPPIWRRLLVRGDTTLARLHRVIQEAMGWYDGHLHTFEVRGAEYSKANPEWMSPMKDERKATLAGLRLTVRSKFLYTYDMGDGWEHQLVVEAVTDAETKRPRWARCLAGARACPPEDVGGTGGYEYFLEAIRDPKHKEHKEMLEWIGGEFDPEAFSVAEADEALKGP